MLVRLLLPLLLLLERIVDLALPLLLLSTPRPVSTMSLVSLPALAAPSISGAVLGLWAPRALPRRLLSLLLGLSPLHFLVELLEDVLALLQGVEAKLLVRVGEDGVEAAHLAQLRVLLSLGPAQLGDHLL